MFPKTPGHRSTQQPANHSRLLARRLPATHYHAAIALANRDLCLVQNEHDNQHRQATYCSRPPPWELQCVGGGVFMPVSYAGQSGRSEFAAGQRTAAAPLLVS